MDEEYLRVTTLRGPLSALRTRVSRSPSQQFLGALYIWPHSRIRRWHVAERYAYIQLLSPHSSTHQLVPAPTPNYGLNKPLERISSLFYKIYTRTRSRWAAQSRFAREDISTSIDVKQSFSGFLAVVWNIFCGNMLRKIDCWVLSTF